MELIKVLSHSIYIVWRTCLIIHKLQLSFPLKKQNRSNAFELLLFQEMDMALSMDNIVISNEEEISMMKAMHLPCGLFLNMVLRAAMELDLFEIIAKSTTQKLSSYEIASQIPTKNPNASLVLERILRFLASQSFLTCNITKNDDGNVHTSYSLTPLSQSLISDKDGSSIVPLLLLNTGPVGVNAW